mgnify:CR=1 FL=1
MKLSKQKLPLFVAFVLACFGCSQEHDVKTRSFYLGFTPFPYDISEEAVNYVYDKIETEADIINHHFDNGVPWQEALTGAPFSQAVIDDWNFRKTHTSASLKVYLSVTPINFSRDGLAAYRGAQDNMALPAPWNTYQFNDEPVKTAYLNYCKRSIDFFKPAYFNMAIEANLLFFNNPSLWTNYLEFHTYIYQQLKAIYPDLPIFTSVAGAHLLDGYFGGNDHSLQRLAALQLMDYSDFYAVSFYPYLSGFLGNPYPENTFDELFSISPKPLVIAETGYVAESFTIDVGAGPVSIESDPAKQQNYFKDLLQACEKRKAKFVINFALRDYDQLWEDIGSPNDIGIAWRDSGFYDENGNARPALSTWKEYFSQKYQP